MDKQLTEQQEEALRILQEEAAEVIQAISKIFRFGMDGRKESLGPNNRQHLETELGDLSAMIDILIQQGQVEFLNILAAKAAKKEKLKAWSILKFDSQVV